VFPSFLFKYRRFSSLPPPFLLSASHSFPLLHSIHSLSISLSLSSSSNPLSAFLAYILPHVQQFHVDTMTRGKDNGASTVLHQEPTFITSLRTAMAELLS
jgi:hypothetical protein